MGFERPPLPDSPEMAVFIDRALSRVVHVRMTERTYAAVAALAADRECSVPDVIRGVVTRYLRATERAKGDGSV